MFLFFSSTHSPRSEFGCEKHKLFSLLTSLAFTDTWFNSLSFSFAQPVALSLVFLIGLQHPPTSCQQRAPLRSSKPANYSPASLILQEPSLTRRTSRRGLPGPPGDSGPKWVKRRGSLHAVRCSPLGLSLNGCDKHEQLLAAMRSRGGGGEGGVWEEGRGNVR